MRTALLGVAVLIATTGCDQITSKLKGDAGATAASGPAEGALPPECETFLARYSCLLKTQGKPTTEADAMRAAWTGASSQAASRPAIVTACATQLTAQAQFFKNAGCDGSATSPVVASAADAGKAATPAPSASVAVVENRWVKGTGPCPPHRGQKQIRVNLPAGSRHTDQNGYCRVPCPNPTCCDRGDDFDEEICIPPKK